MNQANNDRKTAASHLNKYNSDVTLSKIVDTHYSTIDDKAHTAILKMQNPVSLTTTLEINNTQSLT